MVAAKKTDPTTAGEVVAVRKPNLALVGKVLAIPFEVQILPIALIGCDHRYQRPLSEDKVKKIAHDYDMGIAGAFDVAQRPDGSYWVIDGQHRLEAARRKGESEVYCHVRQMADVALEAAFFYAKNSNVSSPKAIDKLRSSLMAGDPMALSLRALVEKCGFTLNFSK